MSTITPSIKDADDIGETLQLIDNFVPPLEPGDYTIAATQTAKGTGDKDEHNLDQTFHSSQVFTVSAPRFSLPADEVHQVYPPEHSQGHFARDLPHIVFNQRIIPWERNIWGDGQPTTPWLALLVFDRAELLDSGTAVGPDNALKNVNPTGTTTITTRDLLTATPDKIAAPKITTDSVKQEHLDPEKVMCQVLEIGPETFYKVMPNKADLPFFAHCRKVKITPKADNRELHPDRDQDDNSLAWYSVVIASRFPAPPPPNTRPRESNVVHLVSLEGYTDYFNNPSSNYFQGTERVRLVSLYSWAFACEPEDETSLFAKVMHGLVTRSSGEPATADELMLRVPIEAQADTPEEKFAEAMLREGYTAMGYQTRQGEKTYGWCRGACTPTPANQLPKTRPYPFSRASQAMIYDPAYGVFDYSYAVAFETGRLMALSNSSFSVSLLNWRRQTHQAIDLLAERKAPAHPLSNVLIKMKPRVESAPSLLTPNLLTKTFLGDLTTIFAQAVAPSFHCENKAISHVTPIPTSAGGLDRPMFHSLKSSFNGDSVAEADTPAPQSLIDWLAQLYVLSNVPFNNLVFDPRMLPKESIRFFYLDRNWLEVLLEGALSVGVQNSRDEKFNQLTKEQRLLQSVIEKIQTLRDEMLGLPQVARNDLGDGAFAGMLLRSALVKDWAGLEIHAYRESKVDPNFVNDGETLAQAAANEMQLLRLSKLSDDVLLCLFPAVPAWVEIDQPKEALHFGVQVNAQQQWVIYPRYVAGPNTGKLMQGSELVIEFDNNTRRLILSSKFLDTVGQKLGLANQPGPAQFAMQMIYAPQSMVFQNTVFPQA